MRWLSERSRLWWYIHVGTINTNDNSSNTSNNDVELDENANEAVNVQQSLLEKHSDKY